MKSVKCNLKMHSKSGNIEIMINDEADENIKDFLIHLKINIKII